MTDLITAEEAGKLLDGTTPGPWELDGFRPHTAHVWPVDGCDDPITGEIDIDNAHLIAAAPDLARTVIALHAQLADAKAVLEAKVAGLVEAAEDAEYDLLQWLECSKALTAAGFNMDGTADVTAKLTAALSHIKRGKTNG